MYINHQIYNICHFVCVSDCDPELFENTLRLREHRLDVEEQLQEEIKTVDGLKKEYDTLTKKVREIVPSTPLSFLSIISFSTEQPKEAVHLFL